MDLSLERLERALAERGNAARAPESPTEVSETPVGGAESLTGVSERPVRGRGRRAAVAAVLRYRGSAPDVLLMKRAERAGDRWSGQVSMPGGREDSRDPDLLATAVRETREEVGIDLSDTARLVGGLAPVRAVARGRVLPMTISPFVFVQTEPAPLRLNHEAEAAFWLPLDLAASGALDSTYQYRVGPIAPRLPCWRHEGFVVWGLTYRMLSTLLAVMRD